MIIIILISNKLSSNAYYKILYTVTENNCIFSSLFMYFASFFSLNFLHKCKVVRESAHIIKFNVFLQMETSM